MLGFLLPGLVVVVTLLKARYRVLAYVGVAYVAANIVALVWALSAEDGEGLPGWLVLIAIALWLGMLGALMVEQEEDSWWARHRMDQLFGTIFRYVGIALLIACPVGLGIVYVIEGTVGAVVVMALFTALIVKVFLWDELRPSEA